MRTLIDGLFRRLAELVGGGGPRWMTAGVSRADAASRCGFRGARCLLFGCWTPPAPAAGRPPARFPSGSEKRSDSQLAMKPRHRVVARTELEENRRLMQDFVREQFRRRGYAAHFAHFSRRLFVKIDSFLKTLAHLSLDRPLRALRRHGRRRASSAGFRALTLSRALEASL